MALSDELTSAEAIRIAESRLNDDMLRYRNKLQLIQRKHANHTHGRLCFKWRACWAWKDQILELEGDITQCTLALQEMERGNYSTVVRYYANLIWQEAFIMTSLDNDREIEFNQELSDLRLVQTRLAQHSSV